MGCIHGVAKSLTQWNTHTHTCTVVNTTVQGPDSYSRTESLTLPTAESVGGPQLSAESLSHIFYSHRESHLTQNHTSSLGAQSFSYHVLIRANSQVPPLLQNSLWDQWRPLLELVLINVLQRNKPNRRYTYIYTHIHTHTHMTIYHNELPHKIMEAKESLNLPFSRWKPR